MIMFRKTSGDELHRAVKLALDLSAVTVRPISTRAERAMPARSASGLRISVPFPSASLIWVSAVTEEKNAVQAGPLHRAQGGELILRWY